MSPTEWRHRFADKFRHATQQRHLRRIAVAQWDSTRAAAPRLPDPAAAPQALRDQLAEDARGLQQGHWQLFGWKTVDVGAPPCWHRDATCGVVIDPAVPSHRLNHRRLPDGADSRAIWEFNRWAEMTRLAMHGWLNGDLAAVRTAQRWLEDWCDRNPTGRGINWTSPLEAALRLLNFCWFDALVGAAAAQPDAAHQAIRESQAALVNRIVPAHAAWVWRYRSFGSSANNHLLGELAALVVAAARWPGLAKIACSAEAAWESLGAEVLRQFAADGGSREHALHYHLFAWDMAWQAARAIGCRAGEVHDRLTQAACFFHDLAPSAEPWDFGDSDDAQVLPFPLHRSEAAGEWKSWMLGEPGALKFWLGVPPVRGSRTAAEIASPWRRYPEAGMAVCEIADWKVRVDASPLGFGPLAAHGHSDATHVSIWDGDAALLIDPGTGGYFAAPELRARLASWAAHNGPQPVQGFQTPQRIGAFLQVRHHATPSLAIQDDTAMVEFHHERHAFRRSVRTDAQEIEITDFEEAGLPFKILWQFAPACKVTPVRKGDLTRLRIVRETHKWLLTIDADSPSLSLMETSVSPAYGRIVTAVALSVSSTGALRTILKRQP
ncbi:MAG: heparinase II/III family protein [Prosthecobacter sp.]|nr:heparinase II/III family protein [Prosthecobacter sp.]